MAFRDLSATHPKLWRVGTLVLAGLGMVIALAALVIALQVGLRFLAKR